MNNKIIDTDFAACVQLTMSFEYLLSVSKIWSESWLLMLIVFCRHLVIHLTRSMTIRWKHGVIHETGST